MFKVRTLNLIWDAKPWARMVLLIVLLYAISNVSHGMNIGGQHKELETDKHAENRDQNTKIEDTKTNEERNLDVIDDVLDHFFEDETEASAVGINQEQTNDALKFFVSTKTKTLKTTVTSTQSLTSYNTCYKGKLSLFILFNSFIVLIYHINLFIIVKLL